MIGIDINHGAHTVKIGEEIVSLNGVNVVFVDSVDEKDNRHVVATRWIEPKLPTTGDPNLLLAQRSPDVRDYLRCDIPAPPRFPQLPPEILAKMPQLVTVCGRLTAK